MVAILAIVFIVVIWAICIKSKMNNDMTMVTEEQSYFGFPQPIILKNNKVKLVQVSINYFVMNVGKVNQSRLAGIDPVRRLELEGIQFFRNSAADIEDETALNNNQKDLESKLKTLLFESGLNQGIEVIDVMIKIGEKSDFNEFKENVGE